MRISDWSSDVCSSDLNVAERGLPLYCLLHCQPAGACTDAVAVIVLPSITSVGCAAAMVPLLARVNAYSARNALRGGVAGPSIDSDRSACGGRSRSEEHTSELQSLMRISYAVFCLKTKITKSNEDTSSPT